LTLKGGAEVPFAETKTGPALTKASYVLTYRGGLEGEGILEELKVHFTENRAEMYGVQRFTGTLGGQSGSFVLTHRGRFMQGEAAVKMIVVPGSATEGLKGLRGQMTLRSGKALEFPVTFHYHFA
jgi:hypothetical protein